jgi:hypothetical protein
MVFKMICAFAASMAVWCNFNSYSRASGATYFSTSRVPKTTPSSTRSGSGSRDDATSLLTITGIDIILAETVHNEYCSPKLSCAYGSYAGSYN